jgi:hypothetical protein
MVKDLNKKAAKNTEAEEKQLKELEANAGDGYCFLRF